MLCNTIVPNDDGALLPLDPRLEVGSVGEVVVEEFEQGVRLLLLETNNVAGNWSDN